MSVAGLAQGLAWLQLAAAPVLLVALLLDAALRQRPIARRELWGLTIAVLLVLPAAATVLAPHHLLPSPPAAIAVLAAWMVGATLHLARLVHARGKVHRCRRAAAPVLTGAWLESLQGLDDHERVELAVCDDLATPLLVGRRILLPRHVFTAATALERRSILAHELSHLRRRDEALLLAAAVTRCLYWVTPLVRLAQGRLRETIEAAADDAVIAAGVPPSRYATQLVALARERIAGGGVDVGQLRTRVQAILDTHPRRAPALAWAPSLRLARLFAAATLVATATSACEARSAPSPSAPEPGSAHQIDTSRSATAP